MRIKKFYVLWPISFLKVTGLAIFPFIFTKKEKVSKATINHELIHHRQQIELLIIPFYIWYIIEYGINLYKIGDKYKAYMAISFEKEAYANDSNLNYLKTRKIWAFRKYFNKKVNKKDELKNEII